MSHRIKLFSIQCACAQCKQIERKVLFDLVAFFQPLIFNPAAMNGHNSEVNQVCVVLGSQWGDEGKGKLVDLISKNVEIVARCQVT